MTEFKKILVTPELAKEYLSHNTSNRVLNKRYIGKYVNEMKKGLWTLSNDAIIFAESGKLLNGQHRLTAVIQSGVTCEFLVGFGFPESTFNVLDSGKARSGGDVLRCNGISYPTELSGIIRKYILLVTHVEGLACDMVGNSTIMLEYEKDKDFWSYIITTARTEVRNGCRAFLVSELGAYHAYLIKERNYDESFVLSFFEQLTEREQCTNNTIQLLRKTIINDKLSNRHIPAKHRMMLFVKTWNAYVDGKELSLLRWSPSIEKGIWFK